MRAALINADGLFLHATGGDYTGEPNTAPLWVGNNPFIRPRWNGAAWVEGADPANLEQLAIDTAALIGRQWRNAELQRADIQIAKLDDAYTVTGENTAEAKGLWRAYRIALRNMPQQHADARLWVRPEAPQ